MGGWSPTRSQRLRTLEKLLNQRHFLKLDWSGWWKILRIPMNFFLDETNAIKCMFPLHNMLEVSAFIHLLLKISISVKSCSKVFLLWVVYKANCIYLWDHLSLVWKRNEKPTNVNLKNILYIPSVILCELGQPLTSIHDRSFMVFFFFSFFLWDLVS